MANLPPLYVRNTISTGYLFDGWSKSSLLLQSFEIMNDVVNLHSDATFGV